MAYGESLLSKVLDVNDPAALIRHDIREDHFLTEPERQAYRFIRDYAEANGQAPDYRTVAAEVAGFTYRPDVADSFEWLARKVKEGAAKYRQHAFFTSREFSEKYTTMKPEEFAEWVRGKLGEIEAGTASRTKVGTDIKRDTAAFLDEYRKRKEGRSFKIWRSKFPTINREIGGYLSGSMYTWYARSGRGKSVITAEEVIEAAFQGAIVLAWIMEMSRYEWMARAYTSISARLGVCDAEIDGVIQKAGFDNLALLRGQLAEEFEDAFKAFLARVAEEMPGTVIIRSVDDQDFDSRKVRDLEADIVATGADVVLVDPFYYMDYETNTSKTTGGDAAETSKKLRRLAGKYGTVLHVITQADEVKDEKNDDGHRELRPPQRAEIKKTKAVLEDATNVLGIDTVATDGLGVIEIGKGRNGGEGTTVELVYLPNYGIVREMETGAEAAEQFSVTF
ncbi:DNA helicase [Brevibacillus borstelensis]|uniref:DNA helicase n=1 Tax=Brevibacillus borstelensis TaxID=45462 RepID=UPI0030CE65D8